MFLTWLQWEMVLELEPVARAQHQRNQLVANHLQPYINAGNVFVIMLVGAMDALLDLAWDSGTRRPATHRYDANERAAIQVRRENMMYTDDYHVWIWWRGHIWWLSAGGDQPGGWVAHGPTQHPVLCGYR